jgi:hypothetical protein
MISDSSELLDSAIASGIQPGSISKTAAMNPVNMTPKYRALDFIYIVVPFFQMNRLKVFMVYHPDPSDPGE